MNALSIITLALFVLGVLPVLFLIFLYQLEIIAADGRRQKRQEDAHKTRHIIDTVAAIGQQLIAQQKPKTPWVEVSFADARAIMAAELLGKDADHDCGYRANLAMLLNGTKYQNANLQDPMVCDRIADDAINMLFGTDDDGQHARACRPCGRQCD